VRMNQQAAPQQNVVSMALAGEPRARLLRETRHADGGSRQSSRLRDTRSSMSRGAQEVQTRVATRWRKRNRQARCADNAYAPP